METLTMRCKKILFLLPCTLLWLSAHSQNVFGFKAGMQLAKMTSAGEVPKSLLTSLQVKGVSIMPLTGKITINPSLGYSGKGFRWNNLWFENQMGDPIGEGDAIGLFHYLQLTIPVSYKINAGQNQEYYIGAGPYFSYAVSGKGRINTRHFIGR